MGFSAASMTSPPASIARFSTRRWRSNSVNNRGGYAPPHSKGPGAKNYIYTLYALSAEPQPDVPPAQVSRAVLLDAIKDKILATAELRVVYSRPEGATDQADPRGPDGGRPPPPTDNQDRRPPAGNANNQGHLFEVTPAGETVWQYVNPMVRGGILAQGEIPGKDPPFNHYPWRTPPAHPQFHRKPIPRARLGFDNSQKTSKLPP
jgi:hypothetical protein